MRAALMTKPGRIVLADDQPEPPCQTGDVLVQMQAVGICGTDLGYWRGSRVAPEYPWVLGHEGMGRIIAVGAGIASDRIGELVAIEPNYPCGGCAPCRGGSTSLCTQRGSVALNRPGLLAERVCVPSAFAWQLPAHMSIEVAVCIEPLAVVLAAIRRARLDDSGLSALVIGAGAQGLLLVETLSARGIDVAVAEPQAVRRDLALSLGARLPTDGELFARTFEGSGNPAGGRLAIESLAPAGTAVFIGVGNDPVNLDTKILVRRGLTVAGSMIYDHPGDFIATLDSIATGLAHPQRTLGTRFAFDETEAAFAGAAERSGKTWIAIDSTLPLKEG